jgi:hypothetical protein
MRFLGSFNHEKGAPRQEISKWSKVCNTFSRSGWSVVRRALLAKRGTSKKRPSPRLHKVPTQSNKVSPRNFQTALVILSSQMASSSTCFSNQNFVFILRFHVCYMLFPPYPRCFTLIILTIFGVEYKLRSFSWCYFLHCPWRFTVLLSCQIVMNCLHCVVFLRFTHLANTR